MHNETCAGLIIRDLLDVEHKRADEIRTLLENESEATGIEVNSEVWELLDGADGGRKSIRIIREEPGEAMAILGEVFGINRQVNFFKRFGIPDTPIARQFMRELATERYVEVTLREDPEDTLRRVFEFTFFVPEKRWLSLGGRQGSRLRVFISPRDLPNGKTFWHADEIRTTRY